MITHASLICTDYTTKPTTFAEAIAIIADLQDLARDLEITRQKHGIQFASDPVKLDEGQACAEIARLWREEQCESAFVVLRQFVATHQGANGEWAAHMVAAANRSRIEAETRLHDLETTFSLKKSDGMAALDGNAETMRKQIKELKPV